jgi:hypothetical protein
MPLGEHPSPGQLVDCGYAAAERAMTVPEVRQ